MNEEMIAHDVDSENRTKDVITEDNTTFQSMFLSEKVLDGLTSCGFRKPSPIQLQAIPLGRCGFDLIVKSKAGTGKTLVFSVISLEVINTDINDLQILILAPTREIAVQITGVIKSIGKNIDDLKVCSFIGGLPEKNDIENAKNCHIAVGAPGRIKSLIKKKFLNVNSLKLFVLDEADKLMEKNFQNDLNEIYYNLPHKKQIIATSATYPEQLKGFLSNYMHSPTEINAEFVCPLLLGLKQFITETKPAYNSVQEMKNKNEKLIHLLKAVSFTQCLIFSNYQTRVETVCSVLNQSGWEAKFISGAQTQIKRLEVMDELKNFKCRVLLSTDLTARGIDAANVDLIINYDVPVDVMTYLHRMGRAGRYGSKGLCITLISGSKDMKTIQKYLGIIGGSNLTISKLPEFTEKEVDLWKINSNEFEQIKAIVENDEDSRNLSLTVKNEILNLKTDKVDKPKSTDQTDNPQSSDKIDRPKSTDTVQKNQCDDGSIGEESLPISESSPVSANKLKISQVENEKDDCKIALESMAKGIFNFESIEATSSKPQKENVSIGESLSTGDKGVDSSLDNQSTILMSLAEGKFDFDSNVDFNKISVEQNSTDYINDTNKTTMYKPNKFENQYECRNLIMSKNKALFEVAKLLTDENVVINSNMEKNLNVYFETLAIQHNLKEKIPLKQEVSCTEVMNCLFQPSASKDVVAKCDEDSSSRDPNLEDIFLHAYKYAIGRSEKHWKLTVPEIELYKDTANENKECEEVSAEYYENMYYEGTEEEEYYEDEVEEDAVEEDDGITYNENGKRIYAYKDIPNRMVWVECDKLPEPNSKYPPINLLGSDDDTYNESIKGRGEVMLNTSHESSEANQSTNLYSTQTDQYTNTLNVFQSSHGTEQLEPYSQSNSYRDEFAKYFEQCSRQLWEDGWRFESVENFDFWFHNWQQGVQDVRDYIRQNIYVKELSNYQSKKRKM